MYGSLKCEVAAGAGSRSVAPNVFKGAIRFFDLMIILLSGAFVYGIYIYPVDGMGMQYAYLILVTSIVSPVAFHLFHCYEDSQLYSGRLRIEKLITAWAVIACILLLSAFGLKISDNYSRLWAGSWFVSSCLLLVASRLALAVRRLGARGGLFPSTVIFGTGENGRRLGQYIREHLPFGVRVIGFIDDRGDRAPEAVEGYPVIGTPEDLVALIRRGVVQQVLIALPWSAEQRIREITETLSMLPVDVRLAPDLAGLAFIDRPASTVGRLSLISLCDKPISGWSSLLKRLEDLVLSAAFLIVTAPLFVLIALCIKLETPGPVLFRQKRYGYNHQIIEVFKFRTMHHHLRDAHCDRQTEKNDPRVTRVGRLLRRSSLDELPQLLNVLRGEMSIVGPRPHALNTKAAGRLFEEVATNYAARHRVKPGITGWAQVNGLRGQTDTEEKICKRVQHDLYYINHWSLGFDLLIMLRTLRLLVNDQEAY